MKQLFLVLCIVGLLAPLGGVRGETLFPPNVACLKTVKPQLHQSEIAKVISEVPLWREADANSMIIAMMYKGNYVWILSEPVCVSGSYWWKVFSFNWYGPKFGWMPDYIHPSYSAQTVRSIPGR